MRIVLAQITSGADPTENLATVAARYAMPPRRALP